MSTLACKHCGAPIPAETISDGELAICEVCSALNNLSDEPIPFPQKDKAKKNTLIPDKISYRELPDGEGIEIRYRWFDVTHWGFFFFFLLFIGPIALPAIISVSRTIEVLSQYFILLPFYLFGIVFALSCGYAALVGVMNSTSIVIRKRGIEIITGPLPVLKRVDKTIARQDIQQVYFKHAHTKYKRDADKYNESYVVYYVAYGKHDNVLVRDVPTTEEALFIEQKIERLYGIKDVRVAGEWGKEDLGYRRRQYERQLESRVNLPSTSKKKQQSGESK